MFEYIPLTLSISADPENLCASLQDFKTIFNLLKTETDIDAIDFALAKSKIMQGRWIRPSTRLFMPQEHFCGKNLWILKVNQLNRGRGIYVFNNLRQLWKLILQALDVRFQDKYTQKTVQEQLDQLLQEKNSVSITHELDNDSFFKSHQAEEGIYKTSTFVIQKYIEDPLLINSRKFDIRIWVFISHENLTFMFKEGYVRTSCEKFSLDSADVDKPYIHLTNNAIQKFSTEYGKFEDGNQLSFKDLQDHLTEIKVDLYQEILSRIREIIKMSKVISISFNY